MNLDNLETQLYIGLLLSATALTGILLLRNKNKQGWQMVCFSMLFISLLLIYRSIGLLYYSEEVIGITKGIETKYKSGSSVKYEYEYMGSHEKGSNSIPSNLDSIKLTNGKYKVRVFNGLIRISWMDFSKPVE